MSSRVPRRRRAQRVASSMFLGLVLASLLGAAAPTGPDEKPTPTSKQLADSVRIYDFKGSVRVYDPKGSVSVLEVQTTKGADTVLTLDTDILFDFASDALSPAAVAKIGELVAGIPKSAPVEVTGHTDAIGDNASNLALSQRRAAAVSTAITRSRSDLAPKVTGRGETDPKATNDTAEGREENRRVEIRYTKG